MQFQYRQTETDCTRVLYISENVRTIQFWRVSHLPHEVAVVAGT